MAAADRHGDDRRGRARRGRLSRPGGTTGEALRFSLRDATLAGEPFGLRPYQQEAADAFHAAGSDRGGSGVIALPCGAGKTIVGMACMAALQSSTLILTTSITAVRQWMRELLDKTTLLTIEDQVSDTACGWGMSFFDETTPFPSLTLISSNFSPDLTFELVDGTINISWDGATGPADFTAVFNIDGELPEPGSLALLGVALVGVGLIRRPRRPARGEA